MQELVVLPYRQKGAQGNEIKLALSGWKKFCQFDYHFAVIGTFSDELVSEYPWVDFIKVSNIASVKGQYTPLLDVLNKLDVAYQTFSKQYTGFVRMMDDFYAIKPFTLNEIKQTYYLSNTFTGNKLAPTNFWSNSKYKTRQLLNKENLPHVNYTTHHPCYFEFEKLKTLWNKYNMRNESYVLDDLYFNYFEHDKAALISTFRLGVWNKQIFNKDFQKAIDNPSIKFVCNSVDGWSKELEKALFQIIF